MSTPSNPSPLVVNPLPLWRRHPRLFALFFLLLLLGIGLVARFWPRVAAVPPQQGLDYGLYWVGEGEQKVKAIPGVPNPFYDPTRPTLLYVHGWQPESWGRREPLIWRHGAFVADLIAPWRAGGWNVGLFYWNQWSDEPLVLDAEAKMWTAVGPQRMRYRLSDGSFGLDGGDRSVGALLYEEYTAVLSSPPTYSGDEIRFLGHSMGNQLVVQLAGQVVTAVDNGQLSPNLIPQRLILADPYWSHGERDFLEGQSTGERVEQIILDELIPRGVLVEWYRSSWLTNPITSDQNEELAAHVLLAELRPWFCHGFNQVCWHEASWHQYLLSYAYDPLPECADGDEFLTPCVSTGRQILFAQQSAEQVAELMGEGAIWVQVRGPENTAVDGRFTPTLADDWYLRQPRP
jgi:hypothetical protein